MFGFFRSKPPLMTSQRAEVELYMRRCVERVGADRLRASDVIGRLVDAPLQVDNRESLLASAQTFVAERMGVSDTKFDIQVSEPKQLHAASAYQLGEPPTIQLAAETVNDPLRLVAALSHSFAQHILQTGPDVVEHDANARLADTLPLCCGLGVLQSDASFYDVYWSAGLEDGWSASRQGYLNAQEIGYALALFARVCGETKPAWKRWLRADSKETMNLAMRYHSAQSRAGQELLFEAKHIPTADSSQADLADWVAGPDLTFALVAGWYASRLDTLDPLLLRALLSATRSSDPQLVPLAVQLLAGAERPGQEITARVAALVDDRRTPVALSAVQAAHALGMDLVEHLPSIGVLVERLQTHPYPLLDVLSELGPRAASLDFTIAGLLPRALNSADMDLTQAYLDCLRKISTDPEQVLEAAVPNRQLCDELCELLTAKAS